MDNKNGVKSPPENNVAKKISEQLRHKKNRNRVKSAAFKSIILSVLACAVVISVVLIYNNWNLLNPKNLFSGFASEGGAAAAKIGGPVDIITGNTAEYINFADGIAVVTTNSVRYATLGGQDGFILKAQFNKPAVSAAGEMLLAYDKNGSLLFVTDYDARYSSAQGYGDTISARINENGYIAVFSQAQGYKCALSVYDKNLNMLYRWKTTDYYGVCAAVSADGSSGAAAVVRTENGRLTCNVLILDLKKEGVAASAELGQCLPLGIWETDEGFFLISDTCAALIDISGNIVSCYDFKGVKAVGYREDGDGGVFAVLNTESVTARYELIHLDNAAVKTGSRPFENDVNSISSSSGLFAVLTGSGINIFDTEFNLKKFISPDGEIEKIIIIADGTVVMVTSDEVLTA